MGNDNDNQGVQRDTKQLTSEKFQENLKTMENLND
jgi:hypothetical protein